MSRPASLDHSHRSSFVDSDTWRTLSWVGVALQALAAVLARWLQDLGGLWIILGFLAGSVVLLITARGLPNLLAFVAILAAVINAGGWAWNWYGAVPWFDELVHAYSPLAIVAVTLFWMWKAGWIIAQPASSRWMLLAAGYGLGLGVAWEFLEAFFIDLRFGDTLTDLVFDTIGAALGGWLAGWVIQRTYDSKRES